MSVYKCPMSFLLAASVMANRCEDFAIPMTTSAQNPMWERPTFDNHLDPTAFIEDLIRANSSLLPTSHQEITGTYNMELWVCRPDTIEGSNNNSQFLICGTGFDRSLFTLSYPDLHNTKS